MVPSPTPPPLFPQILGNKTDDGKLLQFITKLKFIFHQCPFDKKFESNARLCYAYEGYGNKKEISEF